MTLEMMVKFMMLGIMMGLGIVAILEVLSGKGSLTYSIYKRISVRLSAKG